MRPPPCSSCRGLPEPPIRYSQRAWEAGRSVLCPQCREWTRVVVPEELSGWLRAGWLLEVPQ